MSFQFAKNLESIFLIQQKSSQAQFRVIHTARQPPVSSFKPLLEMLARTSSPGSSPHMPWPQERVSVPSLHQHSCRSATGYGEKTALAEMEITLFLSIKNEGCSDTRDNTDEP